METTVPFGRANIPFDNCHSPFSPTTVFGIGVCYVPANVTVKCMGQNLDITIFDITMSFQRTERKGLAKLGNIVAETMFLVVFPGVAKLGNIYFGRKICVREAKMFLTPWQKHFLFPSSKICFRNTCFTSG